MKGVLKCGLFAVLFAVSSIALFTGSSASAISPYDDLVKQHSSFSVDYDSFTAEWLSEPPTFSNMTDLYDNIDFCGDQSNFCQYLTELKDRIDNHGSKNIIVQSMPMSFPHDGRTYMLQMTMYDIDEEFEFGMYNGNYATLIAKKNLQRKQITIGYNSHWTIGGIYTEGSNNQKPYVTNATYVDLGYPIVFSNLDIPEYPEGYEGELVNGGEAGATAHKPNITWSVNDKQVTVSSESEKNTASLEDYKIYWWISNVTTDGVQPEEAFALSGCTNADYNNNFTVPVYFDYGVQAYYADKDCNILQVDDEGNQLSDNMVVLTIDGSTFDGSTTDHEAIIGEIPDNAILKAIRQFRPNDGGLAGLIYAPIEAIATLPTIVGSCSPINLPLLGEQVSLTCIRPTIQASPMGAVYNTISVIVTGMVTWWVAWKTFGTIKSIQDPQDDRVEVLKL